MSSEQWAELTSAQFLIVINIPMWHVLGFCTEKKRREKPLVKNSLLLSIYHCTRCFALFLLFITTTMLSDSSLDPELVQLFGGDESEPSTASSSLASSSTAAESKTATSKQQTFEVSANAATIPADNLENKDIEVGLKEKKYVLVKHPNPQSPLWNTDVFLIGQFFVDSQDKNVLKTLTGLCQFFS